MNITEVLASINQVFIKLNIQIHRIQLYIHKEPEFLYTAFKSANQTKLYKMAQSNFLNDCTVMNS